MDSPKDKTKNQKNFTDEQAILAKESNEEFQFRFLQKDDHRRGFLTVLQQLTVVGDVTQEAFEKRFDDMFPA